MPFADRDDAGRRLGERLSGLALVPPIVLALPRGGVPVGRRVADALHCPLDVIIARKLGAPGNPEYAVGAIAEGGAAVLEPQSVALSGASDAYLKAETARQEERMAQAVRLFREDRSFPDLKGMSAVLVDDGLATGSTMKAAARSARMHGPARVIVAVPVAPAEAAASMAPFCDEFIALEEPAAFYAVGQFYGRFDQVSDEEVAALLKEEG